MSPEKSVTPSNSSAPISAASAPPLTEPAGPGRTSLSISEVTPTDAPRDSRDVGVSPVLTCRLVEETNGAAKVEANERLSLFVFDALRVLVYERRFKVPDVDPGTKLPVG